MNMSAHSEMAVATDPRRWATPGRTDGQPNFIQWAVQLGGTPVAVVIDNSFGATTSGQLNIAQWMAQLSGPPIATGIANSFGAANAAADTLCDGC